MQPWLLYQNSPCQLLSTWTVCMQRWHYPHILQLVAEITRDHQEFVILSEIRNKVEPYRHSVCIKHIWKADKIQISEIEFQASNKDGSQKKHPIRNGYNTQEKTLLSSRRKHTNNKHFYIWQIYQWACCYRFMGRMWEGFLTQVSSLTEEKIPLKKKKKGNSLIKAFRILRTRIQK